MSDDDFTFAYAINMIMSDMHEMGRSNDEIVRAVKRVSNYSPCTRCVTYTTWPLRDCNGWTDVCRYCVAELEDVA